MKKNILITLALAMVLSTSTVVLAEEADATTAASASGETAAPAQKPAVAAQPKAPAKPGAAAEKKVAAKPEVKAATTAVAASGTTYTIAAGDTLGKIAVKFGVTVEEIIALNNIANANAISVGQVIKISGAAPATTVTPAAPAVEVKPTTPDVEAKPATPAVEAAPGAPAVKADPTTEKAPAVEVAPATPDIKVDPTAEKAPATEAATPAEVTKTDVVTSASPKESSDPAVLTKGLSKDGYWIFAVLSDVKTKGPLHVDGTFYNDDDPKTKVYRKLALYAQDDKKNVTAEYTLTTEALVVTSPNFRIQNGKVVGDVYVNADGFELKGADIKGNLYFATAAQQASALLKEGKVSGKTAVKAYGAAVDTVTAASPKESSDPAALKKGLSKDGSWIFATLSDVKVDSNIHVDGTFYSKGDSATGPVYRKLALYAQDADRKVTAQYKLTTKKMYVTTPNFNIVNGTVVGDVIVDAPGFVLKGATIDGNLYFTQDSYRAIANLTDGKVTGMVSVYTGDVGILTDLVR